MSAATASSRLLIVTFAGAHHTDEAVDSDDGDDLLFLASRNNTLATARAFRAFRVHERIGGRDVGRSCCCFMGKKNKK